jgi:hypothetical protein
MTSTKYDKTLDEMLEGNDFQGQNALEYLKGEFHDDELHQLNKQELINLFTKAFVLICLQENERVNLLKQNVMLEGLLQKHLEIYPHLKDADKSDLDFELFKIKTELKNIYSQGFYELVKKLPEIKLKARASIPKSGGDNRWKKDIKKKEKAFVEECWKAGQLNPSQYKNKTKFAEAMIKKFEQDDPREQEKHLSSVAVISGWCSNWEKEKSQSAS